MLENEKNQRSVKGLRSRGTLLACLLWIAAFFLIPSFLEWQGLVKQGFGLLSAVLIVVAGLFIFFKKKSFRVGLSVLIFLSIFYWVKPQALNEINEGFNYRLQDAYFHFRGPKENSGQVLIVDIDAKSLQELGQWPWPRSQVARAVDIINEAGAEVIGFDIVFAEADRLSVKEWLGHLQKIGVKVPASLNKDSESVKLAPNLIKEIVLKEWQQRLEASDINWHLDEALPLEEKGFLLVKKYLETSKKEWDQEELDNEKRYNQQGLSYLIRPYVSPAEPLKEMLLRSEELFYLRNSSEDPFKEGVYIVLDNDYELGRAFHDAKVVAGGLFITHGKAQEQLSLYEGREGLVESQGMVMSSGLPDPAKTFPGIRHALSQVLNTERIQKMTYYQGMFNIVPDRSGAARSYSMLMKAPVFQKSLCLKNDVVDLKGDSLFDLENYELKVQPQLFTYSSLALEMYRVANNYDEVEFGYQGTLAGIFLEQKKGFNRKGSKSFPFKEPQFIPLDFKADFSINFRGRGGAWQPEFRSDPKTHFTYVSLSDVLKKQFSPAIFKDKYVIIGSTDPTLSDSVGSPFRTAFPGVEVHAVVLDNLISKDYLINYGLWTQLYTFFAVILSGTVLLFIVSYGQVRTAALAIGCALIFCPLFGYLCMAYGNVLVDVVYPCLTLGIVGASSVFVNFFVEGREKNFVVDQFSKMVSSDVLEKLRDDPREVSLAGQRADVTVMFSDIEGFTSMSERLAPKDVVKILNDYFTPMANIIISHDGFIDKFMGDAIMACWGVPYPDQSHALKACLSALDQQQAVIEVAKKIKEEYDIDLCVRMGISTGEVSAAMMGSESRKNYTVMGDVVNFGARLESACRNYQVSTLISEATYQEVKDHIEVRLVDKLLVKGKSIPILVYELLGRKGSLSEGELKEIQDYEKALKYYWERNWVAALDVLMQLPGDSMLVKQLIKRVEHSRLNPPSEDWSGSLELLTK